MTIRFQTSFRPIALASLAFVMFGAAATAFADSPTAELHFAIDSPTPGEEVSGLVVVEGWVLSAHGLLNLDLYVNREYARSAEVGLPRVDVLEIYPGYAGTPGENPGFVTGFRVNDFPNGSPLEVNLKATLGDGSSIDLPAVFVVVARQTNQPPFGSLESPKPDGKFSGAFPVLGWALDADGKIERVEILVDGRKVGDAKLGGFRPDVGELYPEIPGAATSGFILWLDASGINSGRHQIAARPVDDQGLSPILGPMSVEVYGSGENTPPFGGVDGNFYNSTLRTCPLGPWNPIDPLANAKLVSGWALDSGSHAGYGSVAFVEMTWDGRKIWNSRTDCQRLGNLYPDVHDSRADLWVNCYGFDREDVLELFPGFEHAKDSGFVFILDPMFLGPELGLSGLHFLTIRATDVEEIRTNIDSLPITTGCPKDGNFASIGALESPAADTIVSGIIPVGGWAFDRDGVERVEIWVDGRIACEAAYGGKRPDVAAAYPLYPPTFTLYSGFSGDFDTAVLEPGEHDLYVRVTDHQGTSFFTGQCRFVVAPPVGRK